MLKRPGLIVLMCAGLCAAQEGPLSPPEKRGAVTEMEGRVVSVDVPKGQLSIKDKQDNVVILQVGKNTTISSPRNSHLVLKNLKAKDPVYVYYTTADLMALQIDVTPAMPVLRDLEAR